MAKTCCDYTHLTEQQGRRQHFIMYTKISVLCSTWNYYYCLKLSFAFALQNIFSESVFATANENMIHIVLKS